MGAGPCRTCSGHPDNPLGAGPAADRRGRRARQAQPELPVGRLRHRGPGRPRRRRQRQRARRRHRPRGARARRRGQVRRRRRRGHLRHLGALLGGRRRRTGPRHQPEAVATTSCSPRTPASASSPTSTATTSACRTCTTPPAARDSDVDFWDLMCLRLALGPDLPVDADAHGPLGQVGARLGRPGRDRARCHGPRGDGRPDLRTPKGTEDGIKVNLPDKVITLAEPHSGTNDVVLQRRPGRGPTSS